MKKEDKIREIIKYKDSIDKCVHLKFHELVQKHGLRVEQFHLLLRLDRLMSETDNENKVPTVTEIASKFNNSQNTMSERITRLENKGLVKREKDSIDKRISRVALTKEGKKLIDSISNEAESQFVVNSISKLEDKEIDTLSELLKKVLKCMD